MCSGPSTPTRSTRRPEHFCRGWWPAPPTYTSRSSRGQLPQPACPPASVLVGLQTLTRPRTHNRGGHPIRDVVADDEFVEHPGNAGRLRTIKPRPIASMHRPSGWSRSFVLASLRALHLDQHLRPGALRTKRALAPAARTGNAGSRTAAALLEEVAQIDGRVTRTRLRRRETDRALGQVFGSGELLEDLGPVADGYVVATVRAAV